ncbi:MAG: segregation ATPase, FtsK/SpoIIIE family [Pedosphaera sp.]|nr:segregation ATPase, FtsK/SpoIIIE family [Pedosphaera sp.]
MTVSNNLGAGKTLELLNALKSAVRDFAEKEEILTQDFRTRMTRERKQREEGTAEQARQLATALSEAEAAWQTGKVATEAKYERRKTWISEGRQASKEQTLERIETRTGGRKYTLQKQMLQAERDRDKDLTTTAANFAEFREKLSAGHEALELLEKNARQSFRGYGKFIRQLTQAYDKAAPELNPDENQLLAQLHELLGKTRNDLARFRKFPLPLIFKFLPVWLLLPLCLVPLVPLLHHYGINTVALPDQTAVLASVGSLAIVLILYFIGRGQAASLAGSIAAAMGKARRLDDASWERSEVHQQEETARIKNEFKEGTHAIDQQLKQAMKEAVESKGSFRERIDEKTIRISAKNEQFRRVKLEQLEREHTEGVKQLESEGNARKQDFATITAEREAKLNAECQAHWQTLETEWQSVIQPIYAAIEAANASTDKLFPAWSPQLAETWTPPQKFAAVAKFGQLAVDVEKLGQAMPKDKRLTLPGPSKFSLALSLAYPELGSLLLETTTTGRDEMIRALNSVILRLLSVAPPGRLNFTVIDPVGLGQSFAGVMHLADYEEQLINSRIWTQPAQIEEKLAELNEHMEKVIQMYLRNEYATIAEYNEQAGDIAEKYHFLVVADFPAGFSEAATKRLLSIAASGARCGVYTLIYWDHRQTGPQDFIPDELRKSSVCVSHKGSDVVMAGQLLPGTSLVLDTPPAPDFATEFIHKVGRSSRDSSRVEVPFSHVAPPDADLWTEDTTGELRVAIGRTGATKLQYLAIGKGTRQHALLAGKTGSGKSTLFHVIITNLALWCSPEQVEFYLVDFKKGVEFKCYAAQRLPHARVVAIESDREFGLSVLQRVDDELKRRGDMFRKLGVQDIAGYKRAGGKEPVPRSLLMIDEFQEFFVEDDKVSQGASVLLDRIVRQGRAFGIHVVLGSQTLGGAYSMARTTLGQMVIRIALQCNEADAYLIMDESNPAPRLLSRPGEGIYNDNAGAVEGNSPFQTVWLPDQVRDSYLEKVRERAARSATIYPGPIVFEGDAPANVGENPELRELLEAGALKPSVAGRLWLGAPNSIKGPTEATFRRQSGNNLLIVGQRDEAVLAIMAIGLVSLAAQYAPGAARFILFDGSPPGTPQREFLERIVQAIPHKVTVAKNNDLAEIMSGLAADMKQRAENPAAEAAPATFLFFHGLQKFSKLRFEEDFGFSGDDAEKGANVGALLNNIICEGTSLGLHVIATCDTYNNVNRFLSRKALTEFEMRVLFQMSATDSASLIDNPKANMLGLHRAVFYNEQEGHLEVFRPYALPSDEWIEQARINLARLVK